MATSWSAARRKAWSVEMKRRWKDPRYAERFRIGLTHGPTSEAARVADCRRGVSGNQNGLGYRHTASARTKISTALRQAWAEGKRVTSGGRPTGIQQKLLVFLKEAGFEDLRMEEPFGRYRVDVYVPSHHLAFEADGEAWHANHPFRDQLTRDRVRDEVLLREHGLPVARLTGTEIEDLGV